MSSALLLFAVRSRAPLRSGPCPPAGSALQLAEITEPDALEALRAEWSALWERCPGATPFQTPEWLLPWWRHLGRGRLWTLTLRQNERLVGLAPLYVTGFGGLPLRRLRLLGTGVSDYLDVLLEPALAQEGVAAICEHLLRCRARWDVADFQQLPPGSPLLEAELPAGFFAERRPQEVCPTLALPPSAEELPARLPARMRQNLRYYRRRLEREEKAVIELAGADHLEERLEELFHLHQARWNRRGLPGVFLSERVRRFHREVAAGFLARGWLHLLTLRVREEVVAALYCFAAGGRGYYYAGGLAPGWERLSPGTLLIARAMEESLRAGASEFDFLRGNEPYKYLWGAQDRVNHRLVCWHRRVPGELGARLIRLEERAERALKRAARRLAAGRR